jgi:predicted N-acetyltransferase YhbS
MLRVGNVALVGVDVGKTHALHVGQPGLLLARLAVSGDDGVARFGQSLTNGGSNAAHASGYECDTFCHDAGSLSLLVKVAGLGLVCLFLTRI